MTKHILLSTTLATSAALFCVQAQAQTIYDSGGFEAPRFSTTYVNSLDPTIIGNLRGQDAAVSIWREATNDPNGAEGAVTGSAVVETGHPDSGLQDVAVTRTTYDDRWAPEFHVTPTGTNNIVNINWSEMVPVVTPTTQNQYGPFFGIEAYDDSTGILRIGGFGIDYTTDELIYEDPTLGFNITPNDDKVTPGQYANLELSLNYATDTYNGYLNGNEVVSGIPFLSSGVTEFTDADISALSETALAADSQQSGTAYFDNYVITLVPEPASLAVFSMIAGALITRRRSI